MEARTGLILLGVAAGGAVVGAAYVQHESTHKAACNESVNAAVVADGFVAANVNENDSLCREGSQKKLIFDGLKIGTCVLSEVYVEAEAVPGPDEQTKRIRSYSMILGYSATNKVLSVKFSNAARLREKVPALNDC